MCGIAGILGLDKVTGTPLVNTMVDLIKHRGPDARGVYVDDDVALGHARLSIIDLSNGANQPFHDIDDNYVIVFNGEIYNYRDVRSLLDYQWKTTSDTEVILAAYIKWGEKCLDYLNGMFALAIWDKRKRSLFIARDRIGVKPFYYYHSGNMFVFCSELRSILGTGLVKKEIDRQSLYQYFGNMVVKTPNTIIKDVFQLCPGEYAIFKDGKLSKSVYWSLSGALSKDKFQLDYSATKEKVRELFLESIKKRMVSDVKVGAFLSGGIDSSASVACMSIISENPVETFSIVFDDKDFDESEYSRTIAQKYKTKHTEFKLDPKDLLKELPDFISDMDSPTVDGINTYMVSKLVAGTGVKVVLTGIGGDELFVGYRNFIRWKKFSGVRLLLKNWLTKLTFKALYPVTKSRAIAKINDFMDIKGNGINSFYANSRSIFLKDEIDKLFDTPYKRNMKNWLDLDKPGIGLFPLFSQYSIAELSNYTLDVLLKDTDQMSMAWALEVREPFFDYHLIEFVLNVPDDFKYSPVTPKRLLVDAMGDLLPHEIVNRPKKGFSFPWDKWLRNELKDYCEESIMNLSRRGIFNNRNLNGLWKRFLENDNSVTWMHIWSFVVLDRWMTENGID